jgi:16S rRNA (cytosine1402-N4)-methyltransferase
VIDKDEAAIEEANRLFATDSRCQPYHDSFAHIKMIAEKEEIIGKTAGILMDLGVSSPQLDTAERGFSFLREGPLDMRMDQRGTLDAATWINSAREEEIARILYVYGEERYSRRIAKKIVEERSINPITTTLQLAQLIAKAHPAWDKHKHPATKSFQAIRLLINQELEDLQHALNDAVDILGPKGRLVVLSFHSLEDRIVKQFLKKQSEGLPLPSHIPVRAKEQQVSMRRIGKAIRPSDSEIRLNSRARSATLRIGEKI